VIPTAALNKVEVRPPAVQVDMEGVREALTSKIQAVTEVAARTIAATPETKIPQPANSWRRLVAYSEARVWRIRAVRSVTRLLVVATGMATAATTEEWNQMLNQCLHP
jgi:hypothetical protein